MEYALLSLNDEIKINIEGVGFVPLISMYPSLWELYIKRLNLNQEYLLEVLKGIKKKPNKSDLLLNKINLINEQIKDITSFFGEIAVQKINDIKNDTCCKSLETGEIYYIDKRVFNSHIISEFEARKYVYYKKNLERRNIK